MTMEPIAEPTFVFEEDKVYALVDSKVVAASDDVSELEDYLKKNPEGPKEEEPEKKATHVMTPNGIKGQILGSVKDVFGEEEVSVRLENGRIAHLKVADADFLDEDEEDAPSKTKSLREKLDETNEGDKGSLKNRKKDLEGVKSSVEELIAKASAEELEELDEISVTAEHELSEIDDRLQYLESEEAEAFAPPAPFEPQVVEQGNMGPNPGGWLDRTVDEMVEEASQVDYEKFMDEGPEAFVAELDEGVVDQPEAVQAIAASFIRSKTAAADPIVRDKYEQVWLDRVEEVRQAAVETATEERTKKEAAQVEEEWQNAPDESLFD